MKKFFLIFLSLILISAPFLVAVPAWAISYMSDKTEIPVDLEVSGAEALCQTDDGFIWIAQYSGLTRYDSEEFTTFKNFQYEGKEYSIINVKALQTKDNVLYIATNERLFVYSSSALNR